MLVTQGLNDRVSGPQRARERADAFETAFTRAERRAGGKLPNRASPRVTVERVVGGHCPQDDAPEAVARAVLAWLPSVYDWMETGEY